MKYNIRKYRLEDTEPIKDILNYYINNSFAAYPEDNVEHEHIQNLFELTDHYPFYVVEVNDKIVGFGLLHPYLKMSTFKHTAEITYFILPDFTSKGLGSMLLDLLLEEAKQFGIEVILASLSSRNQESLNFHLKYGFEECGRFKQIGKKFGKYFDMVWVEKFI